MPFTVSYQIGSSEPVAVTFDITNARATEMLKLYATYLGIDIEGRTIRQIGDLVARAQGRAMWEGARQVHFSTQRAAKEQEIAATVDTDLPPLGVVGDAPTNPLPPSG